MHSKMEPESPMQETVYGTNNDDNHVMSEKVQQLAGNIYQELERMIERYDEDVVKELMPLVVNVLENLDLAVMENQEHEVELELLREDNEQLVTQYEREKQLRKSSEQRLLEMEYATEDERRNLVSKVESLESIVRMLELKSKNSSDHASRLEDKESEMKKEYTKLHERYTELFKTHMDYMERTKILFGTDRIEALSSKSRSSLHFPHLKSDGLMYNSNSQETPSKSLNSPLEFTSVISPNQSTDSNASLKSELQGSSSVTSPSSPKVMQHYMDKEKNRLMMEKSQLTDRIPQSDRSTATKDGWVDGFEPNLNDLVVSTPELDDVEEIQSFSFGFDRSSIQREQRRPNTLYQELSFQDSDALGEIDEGADITGGYVNPGDYASSGMGKEVENLIMENNELLATKNALNIVKDDLIAKVDELTSEQEILREEVKSLMAVKERLKQRVCELEEELRKSKENAEKSKASKSDDEEDVPMAQRKRFTRVEMARVLMERNQYKERLMELQEAVRWTEMIRASRSDSSLASKRNKSSIWKFFSNLFNANDKPPRKSMPYVNVHYNAPTSHMTPALDTMRRKRLGDRHRNLDLHDSDLASERLQQQRAKERREQYKQVRAHVRKDDGRLQAYGWSLPTKTSSPKNTSASASSSSKSASSNVPVPVPVYCRPLVDKEQGMKVWCASGVNLSGGKPEESPKASVVGTSMFYINSQVDLNEVDKLDKELKDSEKLQKEQSEMEQNLSSFVWLCTSTHSSSKVNVIDANNPANLLDSFHVCASHLLCIASVPGSKESDYSVDDQFLSLGSGKSNIVEENEKDAKGTEKEHTTKSKIGAISFVSCSTGTMNRPISADSETDNSSDTGEFCLHQQNGIPADSEPTSVEGDLPQEALPERVGEEVAKMSSVLPTMWLGSQAGNIYVHSSVAQWWRCIHSVKLKDSVLSIVHVKGRVFAALADGTVAIFHRSHDEQWDLINYHVLDLGKPHHSIRCMTVVNKHVWCGYRNCIHVVDSQTLSVVDTFDAHPRKESQVRQMAWTGDGVWVTIRLDSTLRLYHAHTHHHLQDVDIEPYVSKMLGTGKLGFSFVRITALLISCKRLWMGTGNGVVISVPLTETKQKQLSSESSGKTPGGVVRVYTDSKDNICLSSFIPYCSMAQAQLSFHGHRDAVKFFVAVPGFGANNKVVSELEGSVETAEVKQVVDTDGRKPNCVLVLSGGEGYIDFRIGDGDEDGEALAIPVEGEKKVTNLRGDKSHLIVWQVALTE